jgi:hypothetical protein
MNFHADPRIVRWFGVPRIFTEIPHLDESPRIENESGPHLAVQAIHLHWVVHLILHRPITDWANRMDSHTITDHLRELVSILLQVIRTTIEVEPRIITVISILIIVNLLG